MSVETTVFVVVGEAEGCGAVLAGHTVLACRS